MSNPGRPLSPHLSIYRWPVTMAASILHRASGIALAAGLVVFAWWLAATAGGPADYARFTAVADSFVGRACLIAFSAAFFYHLSNGIRHLAWDLGYGFEPGTANASAYAVFGSTLVLTVLFWVLV